MRVGCCVILVLTLLTFGVCKYEVNVKYDYLYTGVFVYHNEKNTTNAAEQVFSCIASVVCTSVEESGVVFDLRMTGIRIIPKDYDGKILNDISSLEIDRNFNRPFTFTVSNEGGVTDVKCLENESQDVIRIKSAIAGEFVTLGENETDELPVKTLDLQGVYMSRWKRERKGEGIEMLTRQYTDEDFIHFRDERNSKDGLIIDILEKKRIKSGVMEKSSSEGQVYMGGSKFNPAKRKMAHKKEQQDSVKEEREYNGSEIYVVQSSSIELFQTTKDVPNHKRRSTNDGNQDLKLVGYMHWDYYHARAAKKLADGNSRRKKSKRLGGWDDLYLGDAADAEDAKLDLCEGEDVDLDTVPATVIRPPWVSDSATASRRRLGMSREAEEAIHDEFERNMTRGFSSSSGSGSSGGYKAKMSRNGLIDVDRVPCPTGLGECFNWAKVANKGDADFGLDFLVNLTMGHVPGCHKNCNFAIEVDTHLYVFLIGKRFVIFDFSLGASNINGFHRNNHIYVNIIEGAKKWGPCKFNDQACAPHEIELIPPIVLPLDKMYPPLLIDQSFDLKLIKINVSAGLTISLGVNLEITVCPPFGLASIGPMVQLICSAGVSAAVGLEIGDIISIEIGGNLNATTKFDVGPVLGVDFSRDVLFLMAQIRWSPFRAWMEVYAKIKFIFFSVNPSKTIFDFQLKPIVFIIFEITYPFPWNLFTVRDPAKPADDPDAMVPEGCQTLARGFNSAHSHSVLTNANANAGGPDMANYSSDTLAELLTNGTDQNLVAPTQTAASQVKKAAGPPRKN